MTSESSNTDKSTLLFQQFKKGDPKALEELFHRTFPRLVDFASKITKDAQVAEDILQDVFIKVWEKKDEIESINIEGYLFRMVRNQCLDYIKFIKVIGEKDFELNSLRKFEELYRIDFIRDEPYLLIQEELKQEIERTIESLPPRCKEVFLLSKMDGLKNREIAEKLEINIKNVERHLARAAQTFKERFPNDVPLAIIILVLKNFF
ncbi:RNA polymerase sigma-70 factor [Mangrovibacterium diazotrophicum]|uniref:RNA polymerase sigma-70 factor (ECF subfamily) n=1 Tax=Mangrovibacterium diazotrophicum TaxID=1261403 RepID=A0A419W664_9BACT|nr:RNA polymerase sigma-70 factor [Mangrovibacterium diazotrophicum]RKD90944.1 RNA polymerase sigma-70 factor (ECF subfamily) [Mangrovibacterium diazotrophicum]